MKLMTPPNKRALNQSAFTLIEMIGVLAVIAILAALLIPKVFNAIADAKINSAVVSSETIKTALADHYGKYGKFDTTSFGTNIAVGTAYDGYDTNVLLAESLIDKPFQTKLGTNWDVDIRPCASGSTKPTGNNAAYSLDGSGNNNVQGQFVLEAIIRGVAEVDAQAISQRIDGTALSSIGLGTNDLSGKVKYGSVDPASGQTDVYIYLTHR